MRDQRITTNDVLETLGEEKRVVRAGWNTAPRRKLLSLAMGLTLLYVSLFPQGIFAQEIPQRSSSAFGFPYPPPPPDEPGVTPFRRYMLDGEPELHFRPRPQDQIWLISTRNIERTEEAQQLAPQAIQCQRCELGGHWASNNWENLLAAHADDSARATLIFVHGYRTDAFWAERRGLQAYQAVVGNDPMAPPVRFVIWSWPSETDRPLVHGFSAKNERALLDGKLLTWALRQFDSSNPVGLLGYSLGTQIVLTGLEGVSASFNGVSEPPPPKYDVALIAPVTHCLWPSSSDQVSGVAARLESMVVFRNSRDRALCAYDLFCRMRADQPGCGIDAFAGQANVRQFDVASAVGSEHNFVNYISASFVRASVRKALLGDVQAELPIRRASTTRSQSNASATRELALH